MQRNPAHFFRTQPNIVKLYIYPMDTWTDNGENDDIKRSTDESAPPPTAKKNTVKRNLIQLIESILASYELQEKYSTKLTSFCMMTIGELIKKKPEFFRMVESTLIRNIHDNKIKAEDIPYIISIIARLYSLLSLMRYEDIKDSESIEDTCGNILKFLFSVSLREGLVKIDNETDIMLLLLCFDNIVDSCMKLVKPSKPREILGSSKKPVEPVTPVPQKTAEKTGCCGCFG